MLRNFALILAVAFGACLLAMLPFWAWIIPGAVFLGAPLVLSCSKQWKGNPRDDARDDA